jgi:hypothetical protein
VTAAPGIPDHRAACRSLQAIDKSHFTATTYPTSLRTLIAPIVILVKAHSVAVPEEAGDSRVARRQACRLTRHSTQLAWRVAPQALVEARAALQVSFSGTRTPKRRDAFRFAGSSVGPAGDVVVGSKPGSSAQTGAGRLSVLWAEHQCWRWGDRATCCTAATAAAPATHNTVCVHPMGGVSVLGATWTQAGLGACCRAKEWPGLVSKPKEGGHMPMRHESKCIAYNLIRNHTSHNTCPDSNQAAASSKEQATHPLWQLQQPTLPGLALFLKNNLRIAHCRLLVQGEGADAQRLHHRLHHTVITRPTCAVLCDLQQLAQLGVDCVASASGSCNALSGALDDAQALRGQQDGVASITAARSALLR